MPVLAGESRQIATEKYILGTKPVLYLPLWKRDGSVFVSDDGYGHLCTVTDATWDIQGRTCDGTSALIDVANESTFDFSKTSPHGIFTWFKTTEAATSRDLIGKHGGGTAFSGYGLGVLSTGKLRLNFIGDDVANDVLKINTVTSVNTGAWVFGGYTYDGSYAVGGVTMYLGGLVAATTTITNNLLGADWLNDNVLSVGRYYYLGARFKGTIGEAIIFNRFPTAQEVLHVYNATKWRYR